MVVWMSIPSVAGYGAPGSGIGLVGDVPSLWSSRSPARPALLRRNRPNSSKRRCGRRLVPHCSPTPSGKSGICPRAFARTSNRVVFTLPAASTKAAAWRILVSARRPRMSSRIHLDPPTPIRRECYPCTLCKGWTVTRPVARAAARYVLSTEYLPALFTPKTQSPLVIDGGTSPRSSPTHMPNRWA